MFDSHVALLLDTAVSLVNSLTDGTVRGRPYTAPVGTGLAAAAAAALPQPRPAGEKIGDAEAEHLARTARELRDVFEAVAAGQLDAAAASVNRLLYANGARPQLDRAEGEPWQLHFHGRDDSLAIGWSAGCATALALAVGSGLTSRLGVCAAPHCDRVYVDNSRNAGREFCSTACQNRTKAAAFRARKSVPAPLGRE